MRLVRHGKAEPASRVLLVGRKSQAVLQPEDANILRDAPLHTAVLEGKIEEVQRLLAVGKDPNRLGTPDWQIRMLNQNKSGRIETLVLMVVNTLLEPRSAVRSALISGRGDLRSADRGDPKSRRGLRSAGRWSAEKIKESDNAVAEAETGEVTHTIQPRAPFL